MIISPSLLAANFLNLEQDIKKVEDSNAKWLHLDVMDGLFVPNLTFGYDLISKIDNITDLFLDVHLMIVDPHRYIKEFKDAGADIITFHIEAYNNSDDIISCINLIKESGVKVGLAINPDTSIEMMLPFVSMLDMVLIMSVNPGFGGQKFNDVAISKVAKIRSIKNDIIIQVDGGISDQTAPLVVDAGANCLVAGSYLFNNDLKENVDLLLEKE